VNGKLGLKVHTRPIEILILQIEDEKLRGNIFVLGWDNLSCSFRKRNLSPVRLQLWYTTRHEYVTCEADLFNVSGITALNCLST
jgi:hypothetical protein